MFEEKKRKQKEETDDESTISDSNSQMREGKKTKGRVSRRNENKRKSREYEKTPEHDQKDFMLHSGIYIIACMHASHSKIITTSDELLAAHII